MLFNSLTFAVFFAVVVTLYWRLPTNSQRLAWLFAASLVFYATWNPPFVLLMLVSVGVDYWAGHAIARRRDRARRYLCASVVVNLGILASFKYADFAIANYNAWIGLWTGEPGTLAPMGWILPLGISFYTFQTMSYTIDVYRGRTPPVDSLLEFAVYVTFFPQLVAGPIIRSHEFAPQLASLRTAVVGDVFGGLTRIAVGLTKKVLLADWLAATVEPVFAAPGDYAPIENAAAVFAYAFQIFFDFSGYCDIALGCAALLGFHLPENFEQPYLSQSLTEFWRRWHMTLSSWLRDYLYIPLGGNRRGVHRTYVNLMLTMLLGGLWHGASWNFVVWGGVHGAVLAWLRWRNDNTRPAITRRPALAGAARTYATFLVVCGAWVFFRAPTFDLALSVFGRLGGLLASPLELVGALTGGALLLAAYAGAHELRTLVERWRPRDPLGAATAGAALGLWLLALALFGAPTAEFIYFQF